MDFALSDEQRDLRTTVRGYLDAHCSKEWLDDLEQRQEYPHDLFEGLARLGLFGVGVPTEDGGYGGGMLEIAIICEELGRFGGSVNMTYVPTAVFGNQTLLAAGGEVKKEYLPKMAAGELRTAFALTEPEAGSDAGAVRTRARADGDAWVLNGSKTFCTGALDADYLVLTARTGTVEQHHAGLTLFMVDATSPGVSITPIAKAGHHAVKTCEIGIDDVVVAGDAVIGHVNGGWEALTAALNAERIAVGAICTGLAQRCTDIAVEYGMQRVQFGRPVATFQSLSHMLADMETETAASRWLTFHAAWRSDSGLRFSKEASMAKAYATECATRTATRGMQVLGGYSYTKDFEMERFYREAKLYEVAGGSTQIQRNIIAREMGVHT